MPGTSPCPLGLSCGGPHQRNVKDALKPPSNASRRDASRAPSKGAVTKRTSPVFLLLPSTTHPSPPSMTNSLRMKNDLTCSAKPQFLELDCPSSPEGPPERGQGTQRNSELARRAPMFLEGPRRSPKDHNQVSPKSKSLDLPVPPNAMSLPPSICVANEHL